jgi:hypothetical protein
MFAGFEAESMVLKGKAVAPAPAIALFFVPKLCEV